MNGELFFSVHGHELEGTDTIRFLRKLMKEETDERKLLIVWDNASIHKARNVKRFLERYKGSIITRLLPPYAPELNPDESIWNLAKHHDLANWCPPNAKEMRSTITKELRLLSRQNERVASAIRHAQIPLPPISHC